VLRALVYSLPQRSHNHFTNTTVHHSTATSASATRPIR
jgi:hypothetical protein